MSKKQLKNYDPLHPIEIVVSTYWPTKIIKEVTITDPTKDSWHNDITLSKAQAQYLYDQLTPLFSKAVLHSGPEEKKQ